MATLREYFENGFPQCAKIHIKILSGRDLVKGVLMYDFAGYISFLALYIEGKDKDKAFFGNLLKNLEYGKTQFELDGKVTLPSGKLFPGELRIENKKDFEILAKYYGDVDWVSSKEIKASKRLFIYSESELSPEEIKQLKERAKDSGHDLQFRGMLFKEELSKYETPLAFICHDSRDKEEVARKIANKLNSLLCPVWYDEFTLKIGDSLRESIEKGLKECKKCVLILSPNFLSNDGWTKKEFNSIFTRELLEKQKLILPVWYRVTQDEVFDYSPSLLDIKGLDWSEIGEEEVVRQLYNAIMA